MAFSKAFLLSLATAASAVAARHMPSGAIAVPLIREVDFSSYLAEFSVGTPPQKEYVKMDTGSPTYSFENPRNPWCQRNNTPCAEYGTFDNTTSSTSIYEGPGFGDFLIDFGSGDFLNDTVSLGGVSTPHMYFGYIHTYAFADQIPIPTTTIGGLALDCGLNTGPNCTWAGPWLLPQLYNASSINQMAVSFYLGPDVPKPSNSLMILGGAYDRAKFACDPFTVPMVDPFGTLTNGQTNSVNVTRLSLNLNGNTTTADYGDKGVGQPVLMDTGNPLWNIPEPIWDPVFAALGSPKTQNRTQGYYVVDCALRNSSASNVITVYFGDAGKIDVPISALVTDMGDGTCASFTGNGGSSGLGAFGDPFLRSAYVIFDQQNLEMTFAQAKHTDEEDLVALSEGGFRA